ncbi:hypothetical protein MPSEU_000562600 [Mayamaea pseudoterrestris]|nr:hypothetical protein MPSEU_000562600 [Mayamaea pseudoterrestris]
MANPLQTRQRLLRGPIIIGAGVFIAVLPFILLHLSIYWILFGICELALISIGCIVLCRDVKAVFDETCRPQIVSLISSAREYTKIMDTVVLDDVFRSIFDPEGLIACSMATCIGTALMYGIPGMNIEYRIQMIQSIFGMNTREAEELLLHPGGYTKLLPTSVQDWLQGRSNEQNLSSNATHHCARTNNTSDEHFANRDGKILSSEFSRRLDDSSSSAGSSTDDSTEQLDGLRIQLSPLLSDAIRRSERSTLPNLSSRADKRRLPSDNHGRRVAAAAELVSSDAATCMESLPSPGFLLLRILVEQLKSNAMQLLQTLSSERLTQVGVSACLGLLAQLGLSQRTRRILSSTIETSTFIATATALAGSLALLATKHSLEGIQPHCYILALMRALRICRDSIRDTKKWQGFIAVIVMLYFSRRRISHATRARSQNA